MNNGRRARSLRKLEESHQKNEQAKNPETTGLALWHYSSSSHRSTERYPIWDSKNPSQCQSDQRHVRAHFRDIVLKPGHPDPSRTPFLTEFPGARSTDMQTAPQNGSTGTQGPPRSGNKLQMTFRNSTWFPEERFNGHECLPASLRGAPTENRDHNDPRAPQDIQGTLRKSRSQVPRPPRANGPRPRATSQRSPTGHKSHQNEC
ncbi:hypothetical protein CDL15_Pgr011727 [Punica granatum]|uniref:Uncharacterized protein n=1 Tax=Punica granatum TaxID=22663 RepID=A0A218XJD0_PUNGR|nr:hypothetical protein CDL15_Pgr011727 [Punica granatum]